MTQFGNWQGVQFMLAKSKQLLSRRKSSRDQFD